MSGGFSSPPTRSPYSRFDDDPGIREALRRGLEVEGFSVRDVSDGGAALDQIAVRPPAILVLDVSMPGLSGVEVVRRVRAEGLTLPVCIVSARDEVDDRVKGLGAGADDYVVKPFSILSLRRGSTRSCASTISGLTALWSSETSRSTRGVGS
jgi:DNA-binding response OmpR family regulator